MALVGKSLALFALAGLSDHAGLAKYYTHEAQELRGEANLWDFMAKFYDTPPEPCEKEDGPSHHAAHCREIAKSYQKAADEAEALAAKHRAFLPGRPSVTN